MPAYPLKVKEIITETPEAVTIVFDVPEELEELFNYRSGQYITLECDVKGIPTQRAFSISSAPYEPRLSITAKSAVTNGISNYLTKELQVGDTLEVWPPKGKFTPQTHPENRHVYYFIGSGSGITPLYSMIKTLLEEEPLSSVHLLYGSRSYHDIIYRDALIELAETYTDQFFLRFQLSKAGERPVLYENRKHSRIDAAIITAFLEDFSKQSSKHSFFICGPATMIDETEQVLLDLGISKNDIFVERYNVDSIGEKEETKTSMTNSCKAHITLDGNEIEIEITDQTILQTLLDAGYDPPFSCTSGVCTTCMAKLSKGTVEMEENYGLDEEEVAKGFILTCQSHPTSEEIEVSYDV